MRTLPPTSTPGHDPELIDELAKAIADAALDKMLRDAEKAAPHEEKNAAFKRVQRILEADRDHHLKELAKLESRLIQHTY